MINGGVGKRLEALQGAFTGDGGTDVNDSAKAQGDVAIGKIDTLTTNLALVSGYTINDGWRVALKAIVATPGTTPGTALFTIESGGGCTVIELQIFGAVGQTITGTGTETLTVKTEDGTVLIPATTATDLAAGEVWADASPTTTAELSSAVPTYIVVALPGNDMIFLEQSGAAAWTTGGIVFYCRWRPISVGINVVAS